jgi:hypothetical protein
MPGSFRVFNPVMLRHARRSGLKRGITVGVVAATLTANPAQAARTGATRQMATPTMHAGTLTGRF